MTTSFDMSAALPGMIPQAYAAPTMVFPGVDQSQVQVPGTMPAATVYAVPEQAPPQHMVVQPPTYTSTNPQLTQSVSADSGASSPYTLTTTVSQAPGPQLSLPTATTSPVVTDTATNVIEAEDADESKMRSFEPTEHSTKGPDGKEIKYRKIAVKYMMGSEIDELLVNLCELTAPDGIRANVYEKKEGDNVILDSKTGKPITTTEHSIRVTFSRSNDKHVRCLNGLNVLSRGMVKALYTHRHRAGVGEFSPELSDSTLKPIVSVPKDKNTGAILDLPPSMYLKVHKKKRTACYYNTPAGPALLTGDQCDILNDRLIVFVATIRYPGLYIGSKASIQSSTEALFITFIGQKIDPNMYIKTGASYNESAVTKLTDTVSKLLNENAERKKAERERAKLEIAAPSHAVPTQQYTIPGIPQGGNGFSGLPGGQIAPPPHSQPQYGMQQGGYPQPHDQHANMNSSYPGAGYNPMNSQGVAPQGYNPMGQQGPVQGYNPMGQAPAPGYQQQGGGMNAQHMQSFTGGAPARFN